MNKLVTLTAAVLTVASFSTSSLAADGRTVAYGDLNLASPAGIEAFNRRVEAAAKQVCGDTPGVRSLAEELWIARCIDTTVADHARSAAAFAARTV